VTEVELRTAWDLVNSATQGPWDTDTGPNIVTSADYDICGSCAPVDAAFIAASRALVPRLLAEVEALARDLAAARARNARFVENRDALLARINAIEERLAEARRR